MLSGGCFCGAIRYETSDQVFQRTICHCPSCRGVTGTAHVPWLSVKASDFRIVTGTPTQFHSSPTVVRTFCGTCGTQLTYHNSALNGEMDLTICSLDDAAQYAPADHTFAHYRLEWDRGDDGLPVYQRTRDGT